MTTQTPSPPSPGPAYVALGSNLAWLGRPPAEVVRSAAASLERFGPVRLSPLYESPSWPDASKPPYVNAVAAVETALTAEELLAACQAIEAAFGRRRDPSDRNAPRTLDLDLIDVGGTVLSTPALTLPHPRATDRAFVLAPLADLSPRWRHPVDGRTVDALLRGLDGPPPRQSPEDTRA